MSHRKIIPLVAIWLLSFGCVHFCWGQFQFFGIEGGAGTSMHGIRGGHVALGYLRQFSTYHGWGAEIAIPVSQRVDLTNSIDWDAYTPWEGVASWTRKPLPSIGLRYRFFAGNYFFIGPSLHFGAVRENCFVDREYTKSYENQEVLPLFCDYTLVNPYLRLSVETGLHWPMGNLLYGSILLRGGPQLTFSRANTLVTVTSSSGKQELKAYRGVDVYGNVALGLGVKL